MSLALATAVGVLFGVGTYLLLQRTLTRVILGLATLAHGANLLLLASGGAPGRPPIVGPESGDDLGLLALRVEVADPLPQALALTAIVISFGVTAFLLALAYRSWVLRREDLVADDPEDLRIARLARRDETEAAS